MRELTIKDILGILRKYLFLLIIAPVLVALVAAIFYYGFAPNEYTAEARLLVIQSFRDATDQIRYDQGAATQFAADYKELIQIPEVLDDAAALLGVENLDNVSISINSITGTRVLRLQVTGRSPTFSTDVANAVSDVFIAYVGELTKGADNIDVAHRARVPSGPSGPPRTRNVMLAFALTLFLCGGAVLAVELLNTTMRTDTDVTEALNLPVLASVEDYEEEIAAHMSGAKNKGKPLFSAVSEMTQENIKTLLTNIQFSGMNKQLKTMVITSTLPDEGKSSLAVMLASAMAEERKKVLIVDLDFRNPSIGKFLHVRNRYDLIDYLSGERPLSDIIGKAKGIDVYFTDSMHKNTISTNILKLEKFDEFIAIVSQTFDFIIFDTPPLGMFIDAAILAAKADATLLVVASGVADRAQTIEVVDQFQKANANIIGVALNFVHHRSGVGYYRYSRYHYYRKGYGYGYGRRGKGTPRRLREAEADE